MDFVYSLFDVGGKYICKLIKNLMFIYLYYEVVKIFDFLDIVIK